MLLFHALLRSSDWEMGSGQLRRDKAGLCRHICSQYVHNDDSFIANHSLRHLTTMNHIDMKRANGR